MLSEVKRDNPPLPGGLHIFADTAFTGSAGEETTMEAKVLYMVGSMTADEQNEKHIHDPIFLKANYPDIDGEITMNDFKKYWKL